MFSLRIVSTSHYQAEPVPDLDVQYSTFRSTDVRKVPVLRIFGATPAGQKTCMHVHGVFPYLYVPYDGTQPADSYLRRFAASLDKAINVANSSQANTQHVFKISLVAGIPMYGYHAEEQQFLKIYLYNPSTVRKAADLLLGGAVMNKSFQPHEAHIPFPLQLFIDYNLYGMNLINVAAVKFRRKQQARTDNEKAGDTSFEDRGASGSPLSSRSIPGSSSSSTFNTPSNAHWDMENIPSDLLLPASVERQSVCELEVDVVAADILNRREVTDNMGKNPGLAAIWEDERQRRRDVGQPSQITPQQSQEHDHVETAASERELLERFTEILQQQQALRRSESEESEMSIEESTLSPEDVTCIPASQLEDHSQPLSQQGDSQGSLPSSQDTVVLEEEEEDVVISLESIQRVVSFSQSFSRTGSQPTSTPPEGEAAADRSLVDVLAALAEESSPISSQRCAAQVEALEDEDSMVGQRVVLPPDPAALQQDEEETLHMSQTVPEDIDCHDVEGLDSTWNGSPDQQKEQCVMDSDEAENEDEDDDDIPQLDGASDKKSGSKKPGKKRLGVRGPVLAKLVADMREKGASPKREGGGLSADRVQTPLQSSCQPACDSPDGSSGHPHSPPATHNMVHSSTCQDPLSSSADSPVSALSQSGGGGSGGDMFGVSMTTSSSALKQPTGSSSSVPPNAASSCPGSASSSASSCLLPISHSSEDSGHKRRGESVSEQHPQKQASSRSPFSSTSSEVKVSSPVWMDQMSSSMMEVCGNNAECGSHQGRGSACSSGSASSSSHCVVRVERVDKWTHSKKLALSLNKMRRQSHLSTVTGPPPLPSTPGSSYSFIFHLPTPIFKRLKMRGIFTDRHQEEIKCIRMHPLDAQQNVHQKIGQEVVHVSRLSPDDLKDAGVAVVSRCMEDEGDVLEDHTWTEGHEGEVGISEPAIPTGSTSSSPIQGVVDTVRRSKHRRLMGPKCRRKQAGRSGQTSLTGTDTVGRQSELEMMEGVHTAVVVSAESGAAPTHTSMTAATCTGAAVSLASDNSRKAVCKQQGGVTLMDLKEGGDSTDSCWHGNHSPPAGNCKTDVSRCASSPSMLDASSSEQLPVTSWSSCDRSSLLPSVPVPVSSSSWSQSPSSPVPSCSSNKGSRGLHDSQLSPQDMWSSSPEMSGPVHSGPAHGSYQHRQSNSLSVTVDLPGSGSCHSSHTAHGACSQQGALPSAVIHLAPVSPFPHHHHHPVSPHHGQHSPRCSPGRDQHSPSQMSQSPQDDHCSLGQQSSHALQQDSPDGHQLSASGAAITGTCENKGVGHVPNSPTQALLYSLGHHGTNIEPDKPSNNKIAVELTDINGKPDGDAKCHIQESGFPLDINSEDDFCGKSQKTSQGRTSRKNVNSKVPIELKDLPPVPAVRQSSVQLWCLGDTDSDSDIEDSEESSDDYCPTSRAQKKRGKRKGSKQLNKSGNKRTKLSLVSNGTHSNSKHAGHDMEKKHGYKRQQSKNGKTKGKVKKEQLIEGVHYIVVGKFKGHRVMLVKLERVKVAPSESVKVSDWQGKKAWSVLKTKPRLLGPRCRRLANGTSASDPSLLHTPSKTGPANSSDSESDVSDPLDGNPASPLLSERKPRTSVDGEYHGSEKAIVENEGSQENGTVCTDALLQLNGTGNNKELEGQSESVNTMDFQWQQNIFSMQELQLQNGIVNTEELKEPNTIMNTKERQQQGGAVDTEELQLDSTVNCDESQQQNCPMNDKKLRLDCIVNAKKLQCQNGSMDNEDLSQQDSFVNRKELQQQDSSMNSEELQGQDRFVNKERNNSVDSEELKCPQNSMNSEELQQDNTVNCEKLQQNGCVNTEELQEQGGTVDEKLQEITVTTKDVEQTDTTSTSEGAQMQDKHEKSDRSQEITRNCRVQLWEVVARRRKQKKALSKISSLQSDLKPRPGKDADSGLEGTGENTAENLPTQDTGSGSHLSLVGESKSTDKRQVDRKRSASPLPCPSDEGESSQEGSAGAHPPSAMDVDTDSRMAASESTSHTQSPVPKTGKHCVDLPFTMSEHSQDADCSSLPQSNPESTSSSPAFPRMAMTCTDNKDKHEQPLTQAAPSARLTKEVCEGESQSPSPFCFQTVCDKVKEVGASQRALEASSDSSDSRDGVDEVHRKDHHKPQSLSFSWKDKLQLEDSVLTADMDKEKLKKQKKLTPNQRLGVAFLSKRRRKGRMKGSSIKGENGAGSSKVMDSLSLLHMATLASLGTSSGDHKYPCTPWRVVSRKAEEKENHDVCTLQHSAETNLQWKTFSSGKKEGKFDSVVVEDPSMVSPERGTGIHDGQTIEENMKMAEGSSDVQNLNHLHPLGTKDTGKIHRDKESDKSSEETDDYQISEFAESQFGEKLHAKTNAKRREISTENSNEDMCKESESKSDRELQEGENVTVNRKCKNRKPPVYEDSDEQTEDSDEKTDDYTMTVKMPAKRSTNRQAAGHRKRRIKRKTRRQRTESSKGKNKLFDSLDVLHMATLASLGADPTPAAHDDTLPRYSDSVWDHTDDFEESLSKMAYTSPVHSDLADLSPPLPLSPEDLSKVNVGRIQEQRAMPCRLKLDENWGTRNVCMAQVRAENAAERLSRRFAPLSFPSQQQSCQVNGTMKSLILGGTSPGLKRPSASVLASESAAQPGLAKSPSTSRDRNVCSRSVSTSSQSLQPTIPNPDKFPTPSIPWHHPLHVVTDCTDGRAWKERVIHDVMKEKFNSRSASLGDNTSPSLLPHSRDVPHAEDRLASVSSGSSSQSAVFLKTPPTPTGLQRESKRMHSSSSASMGSVVDRTSPRVLQSDATALRRLSASYGPLGEIHNQVGSRPLLFTSLAQRYAQRDRSSERVPSASDGGSGLYDRGGIKSPGILQPDVHNMNNVLLHRNELHGDPYGVSSPSSNQSIGGCHQWSGQSPSSSKEPERGLYCNVKSSPVSAFSHSSRTPPGGVRFHWSRSVDSVDSGEVRSLVDGDVRNHREGVMVTDRTAPASGSQLTPTSAKWLSDISNMNSASQTEKPSPANQHSLPASHHSPRISRTEMIISQMFNLESVSSAGKPVQASPGRSVDSLHGDRWPDGKLGMAKTVWRSLPEQETESHRDRLHNINLVKSPPSASWEQPPVCLATSLEYHLPSSHNSAAPCLPSRLNCGENMSACFSLATQKSPVVSKYIDSFRSSYNETIQPQVESSDKDKIGKSPSSVFCDKSLLAVNSQSAGWYKSTTSPVELSKIRSDQSRLTAAYQDSVACSPKSSRNYSSSLSTRWSEYSSENHSNFLLRSFSDSDQSKGDGKLGIGSSIQKTFYSPRSCSSNTGERNLSRVKETEPFNKDFCGSKSPIASSTTLAFNTFPSSTKSPGKGSPHSKYLENSRLNKTDVWPQQGRKRSIGDYLEEVIASAYGKVSPEEQPSSWSEAPRENCTYPVRSSQETDCTQVMTANGQTSSALDLTMCSGKVEESAVLSASGSMSAQTAIVSDVPVTCVASLSSVSSGYGTACLPSMLSTTYQTDASSVTTNTATVVSCTSSMPPVCSALVSTGRPTWTTIKTDDFENITDDEDEEVIPSSQDYSTSAYRFPGFRRLSNISSSWTPYSLPSQHRLPAVPKGSCQSSEDVDGRASMSETMLSSHSYGSSLYNYSKGLYSQCSSVSESSRMNREERICLAGKGQENYRDSGSDSLTQQPLREEQGIVSSLGTPWRASQSSTAAPTSSTHMSQFEPITDSEDEEERDKADITDPQGSLSSSHVRTSQFLAAMSSASFTGTSFFPSHTDKRTSSAYTPLSTSGLGLTSSSVYPHLCGKPMLSSSLLSQRDPARSSEFTGASDRSFATVSCPVDHPSSTNKDMDSTLGRSVVSNMADDRMHSSQLVCAEGGGDRHEGSEPEDGGGRKRKKGAGASPSDRPPSSNQGLHREDDSEKPEKSEDMGSGWRRRSPEEATGQQWMREKSGHVLCPRAPPPSREVVEASAVSVGLSVEPVLPTFCSHPPDLPDTARELGGRVLRLPTNMVRELEELPPPGEGRGLGVWQSLKVSESPLLSSQPHPSSSTSSSSSSLSQRLHAEPQLRFVLAGDGPCVITPVRPPPSCSQVTAWLQDVVQKMTPLSSKDHLPAEAVDRRRGEEEEGWGAEEVGDLSLPLDIDVPVEEEEEARLRDSGDEEDSMFTRLRDTPRELGEKASRKTAHSAESGEDMPHGSSTPKRQRRDSDSILHSTPVRRSSSDLFDVTCTPIGGGQRGEGSGAAQGKSTDPQFVTPKHPPLRRLSTNTQAALTKAMLTTDRRQQSFEGEISQIDAPTPKNAHGFKVTQQNLQDAKALHKHQFLTVLSMEVHADSRGDLLPDPEVDAIRVVFYAVFDDVPPERGRRNMAGVIVVDKESCPKAKAKGKGGGGRSSQPSTSMGRPAWGKQQLFEKCGVQEDLEVVYVPSELDLLQQFAQLIVRLDPDILLGFEVQQMSWGFLLQRAAQLSVNLCSQIARIHGSKQGNRFSAASDEWGADYTSEIHIEGRIVLNLWRLLRHEVTLNVYSYENCAFHILHRRVPAYTYRTLTSWYDHRTHLHAWRVVGHYAERVRGQLAMMDQLDLIGKTSEFARVFGIEFYDVLSRGSQYRVESMMLRLAKPLNFIPVSPSVQQRARQKAAECIPLTLEPRSLMYTDPVVVLDFQSLYPSIMIAYNYCFSTCLGRLEHLAHASEGPIEFGCTSLSVSPETLKKVRKHVTISPNGCVFVKGKVRRGVLPMMVEEILKTRLMVKKSMKDYKDDKMLHRMLDARQLGLKLIANVTYGYTGASFSGRMPCIEVADSIVRKARESLERAIQLVEDTAHWHAEVVYGDTDSLFIRFPGRSKDEAFVLGQEIADAVTNMFPKPMKLKFEKVYLPCVLQTKKRYVGFMYETRDQREPVFDAKGIETVRRDNCGVVSKVLERCIKILFTQRDVSQVRAYLHRQLTKMLAGRVGLQDFVFAKEYRGMMGYKPGACVPALEIARKRLRMDRRAEPRVGERVPYVIVHGSPGLPLIQLVRQPRELLLDPSLRVNITYYINKQVLPALDRLLSLVGVSVFQWYSDMPKVVRLTAPLVAPTSKQGTISQYFVTSDCLVCERQTKEAVCPSCRQDPQMVALTLATRCANFETVQHRLAQVCQTCMGVQDSTQPCVSLDCPVLFRRHLATLDLARADLHREALLKLTTF